MATYTATVYEPGQPARVLTAEQVAALAIQPAYLPLAEWETELRTGLIANTEAVAHLLGVHAVDVLDTTPTAVVYALSNAADYNSADNPEAEEAVWGALGERSELVGIILLIVQTPTQAESTEHAPQLHPRVSIPRDLYEEDGDWLSYHEQRGGC